MSDFLEEEEEEDQQNPIGEYVGGRNKAGERHGYGVAVLPNGDRYRGFYRKGRRHGRGHYRFKKNACRYTGEWQDGMKHGRGVFVYPDGTKYEGYWENDMRSGQGSYHFINGNKYVGEWQDDKRQGLGICHYVLEQCKYIGQWEDDHRHGNGVLLHQDHRFDGSWKNDFPEGPGCYIFGTDLVQEGRYELMKDKPPSEEGLPQDSEEEELGTLTPMWKPYRVLCGEAAQRRIERCRITVDRIQSHVSIGSVDVPPERPPEVLDDDQDENAEEEVEDGEKGQGGEKEEQEVELEARESETAQQDVEADSLRELPEDSERASGYTADTGQEPEEQEDE